MAPPRILSGRCVRFPGSSPAACFRAEEIVRAAPLTPTSANHGGEPGEDLEVGAKGVDGYSRPRKRLQELGSGGLQWRLDKD